MLRLLLTCEVAELLRVSHEHVRDLCREGKIKYMKEGNRGGFRFRYEDVEKYVKNKLKEA